MVAVCLALLALAVRCCGPRARRARRTRHPDARAARARGTLLAAVGVAVSGLAQTVEHRRAAVAVRIGGRRAVRARRVRAQVRRVFVLTRAALGAESVFLGIPGVASILRFAHGILGTYLFGTFDWHFDWFSILISRNWRSFQARSWTFDITLSTQNRVAHKD